MDNLNEALWIMLKGLIVVFSVMILIAGATWASGRFFIAWDKRDKEREEAEREKKQQEKEKKQREREARKRAKEETAGATEGDTPVQPGADEAGSSKSAASAAQEPSKGGE